MTGHNHSLLARLFAGTELQQAHEAAQLAAAELQKAESARRDTEATLAQVKSRQDELELERQKASGILAAVDTSYACIEFKLDGGQNATRLLALEFELVVA